MGLTTISNVLQCVPLAVIVLVPQTDFYDGFYKGTKAGAFPIVLCRFLLRSSICLGYTFCFFLTGKIAIIGHCQTVLFEGSS